MKLKMYVVYDAKVGAFLSPFFMRSKGEALRAWEATVNDAQTNFCKFPSDYTLFEIGEFDDATGQVACYEAKISLGLAIEFKNKPEAPAPLLDLIDQKAGN